MNLNDSEFAQIEPLPPENAGKILSAASFARVRTLYGLVFPLIILGSAGQLAWAVVLRRQGIDGDEPSKTKFALLLCFLAICVFLILLGVRLFIGTRNHWLLRIARNEVLRRPDKIVSPDTPGVRFVEIVPKSNWSKTGLLENASDVGFFAVDDPSCCLLYEGDNERYRIPAKAIIKCEQDSYTRLVRDPYSKEPNNKIIYYHFVVVTVKVSETMTVEIPFRIRKTVSLWLDQKAREANYELLRELNHLKAAFNPSTGK